MLGVRLERTVNVAIGNARWRMCDKHIYPRRNLREPADERVVFALERPGVGNDRNPGRPVELHAIDIRPPVAEEMDIRREVELPVDVPVLEKYVCNREEVVVAWDHHEDVN